MVVKDKTKNGSHSQSGRNTRRASTSSTSPPPRKTPKTSQDDDEDEDLSISEVTASPPAPIAVVPVLETSIVPLLAYPGSPQNNLGNTNVIRPETIDPKIDLSTVGGLTEQVAYIRKNILYPMENKEDFEAFGMEPIKGVIFHGPPGTGKTLLAKALASELSKNSETKINFFMRKGSDCYSQWMGESEKTLRTLFRTAQQMKPSIIFLDELDGLCPARQDNGGGHHFYTAVVTCLLGLMDEIKRGEVFLIGATNRLDALDPAVRRPGRFDKALEFYPPNETGRKQILEIALRKWKPSNKPSQAFLTDLARRTTGFTGADLEQLCREAFDRALDRQMPTIGKGCMQKLDVQNLKVLEVDWNAALAKMGKSNSNVFGNSLYTGDAIDPTISILLNGIVSEISDELKKFFRHENSISDPSAKGTGIKSFLVTVTAESESSSAIDTVNTFIFPSIMASFDAEKTPGFILNDETLCTTSLMTILGQVHNCRKGCFLFIPRIDKLWHTLGKLNAQDIFSESIQKTRGTDIVIVASAGSYGFDEDLRSIFHGLERTYEMRKPSGQERLEFFNTIFNPTSKFLTGSTHTKKNQKLTKTQLEKLSIRAQKITHNNEIMPILNLHGELALICSKQEILDPKILLEEFNEVLDEYEKTKFDPNATS